MISLRGNPVRRDLWTLHLSRQIGFSLFARPISAANDTYVHECLSGLRTLRGSRAVAAATSVAAPLDEVLRTPTRERLHSLMSAIDETGYARRHGEAAPLPLQFGRLRGRDYRQLIFVNGPGIGLGDEIAVLPFYRALATAFPRARPEVYTSYPAMWRELAPGALVRSQVQHPARAYERIEELVAMGVARSMLVAFVNFTGLDMLLPYRRARVPFDAFELALGHGRIDLLPAEGQPEQSVMLDVDAPSLARARDALARHLLGERSAPPAPPDRVRRDGTDFVLVVNPLTSKQMPVAPRTWARLVSAIRAGAPTDRRFVVRFYAGLSASARAIASGAIAACRAAARRGDCIDELGTLTSANAISRTAAALSDADLLLGMDTFTAHLAAETGTPSIALCLTRNPLFWEPMRGSFWLDLTAGADMAARFAHAAASSLSGRGCPLLGNASRQLHRAAVAVRLLASATSPLDLFSTTQQRAVAALDSSWSALTPDARRLFERFDGLYAWPHVRSRLTPAAPLHILRCAGARIADTMFFRLVETEAE